MGTAAGAGCTPCPPESGLAACTWGQLWYNVGPWPLTRLMVGSGRRRSWVRLGGSGVLPLPALGSGAGAKALGPGLSCHASAWPYASRSPAWPSLDGLDGLALACPRPQGGARCPGAGAALAAPQPAWLGWRNGSWVARPLPWGEHPAWWKPGLAAVLEKIIFKSSLNIN